ncbi:MAG: hypothetical protein HY716_10195 [Planctomycetes bacterium]|nr:hypothetical protein [Planctomycetota bacterium]
MSASYMPYYIPIIVIVMLVLEICKYDDPKTILKRAFTNVAVLTGVLAAGMTAIYFVNKYF